MLPFAVVVIPLIPNNTANPQLLAAFANDEPWLTMALEGMTVPPYGNPANFIYAPEGRSPALPAHWGHLRYDGIFYYGGAYLGLGFLAFAPLKALGFETFPTAPIILRAVSAIAGLLSLVLLYNLAKRNTGIGVAVLCTTFMVTESNLISYSLLIHPDALQLLFGLLTFLVAVEHAKVGNIESLLAVGFMVGVVQGTKVGGPWLIPLLLAAVAFGMRRARSDVTVRKGFTAQYARRLLQTGAASLLGFFITTPYALVHEHYAVSLYKTWGMVKTGPFEKTTILTWLDQLSGHLGGVLSVVAVLALVRALSMSGKRRPSPIHTLAAILAVSQIAWFGFMGGLWVVIGYLLVALSLLAFLGADMVVSGLRWVTGRFGIPRVGYSVSLGLLFLMLLESRWGSAGIEASLFRHLDGNSTVVTLNRWATAGGLPRNALIIHDDLAYFRPQDLPNARMHGLGGVLTWPQVRKYKPDYIILSSSLYGSSWYQELRRTQNLDSFDVYPYSMRLYQDLVETNTPGPTRIPGVELVREERPRMPEVESCKDRFEKPIVVGMPSAWYFPNWLRTRLVEHLASLSRICTIFMLARRNEGPAMVGPTLKVFRIDPSAEILQTAHAQQAVRATPSRAFASSTAPGYLPEYAFDKTGNAWAAEPSISQVGNFVGYDFGPDQAQAVSRIRIMWVYELATPSGIRIEYSDDGLLWKAAGEFAVKYPKGPFRWWQKDESKWWVSEHKLENAGAHRFWRVVASEVEPGHAFALAEITLVEQAAAQ